MSIEEAIADISFQRNMYSAQVKKKSIAFILWFFLGAFAAQQMYTKRWLMVFFHYVFHLAVLISIPVSIKQGNFSFIAVWITLGVYAFLAFGLFWYQVGWHNQTLANSLAKKPNSFWLKTLAPQELISVATISIAFVVLIIFHPFDSVKSPFDDIAGLSQSNGFLSRQDETRRISARQDIGTIMQSLKLYRLDNGSYPTQAQGLAALVQMPSAEPVPNNWKEGGYLERLPKDPWGNAYQYSNPGVHGEIDVFSYGADGKPGGEGNDADVGSWQ